MASQSTNEFVKRMAALKNNPTAPVPIPSTTINAPVTHYNTTQLQVAHDIDKVDDGMIFTMKDANVLNDTDDADTIENIELLESNKQQYINQLRNQRQPHNNAVGNDLFDRNDNVLLSKYDEYDSYRNTSESLTLGGLISKSQLPPSDTTTPNPINLSYTLKPASDIKSIKFRSKTKHNDKSKNQRRTDSAAWWLDTVSMNYDTATISTSTRNTFISDSNNNDNNSSIDIEQQRRDANYIKALQKAKQQAAHRAIMNQQNHTTIHDDTTNDMNDSTDTDVKQESVNTTKVKKHDPVKSLADIVRTMKTEPIHNIQHDSTNNNNDDINTVTFTATSQFTRGLLNHNDDDEDDLPPGINIVKTEPVTELKTNDDTVMNDANTDHQHNSDTHGDNDELSGTDTSDDDLDSTINDDTIPDSHIDFMHSELNLSSGGVSAALQLAKQRALLKSNQFISGRTNDQKSKINTMDESLTNQTPSLNHSIELIRLDEFGRPMTEKEQFRQLSYIFHGIKPGKKSQEKRLKKLIQQYKINSTQQNNNGATNKLIQFANKSGYASAVFDSVSVAKLAKHGKPTHNKQKSINSSTNEPISKKSKSNHTHNQSVADTSTDTTIQSYNTG